jgi:hypothetical protein
VDRDLRADLVHPDGHLKSVDTSPKSEGKMTTPTMSTPDPATTPAGQPAAPSALLQPLIVDVAAMDGVGPTEIARLVAAGYPWAGLAMQCSHGLRQVGHWFDAAWHASSRGVVAGRYAQDWFRIAYRSRLMSHP